MPIYEIERHGRVYEVEAPDPQAAVAALTRMSAGEDQRAAVLPPMRPVPSHAPPSARRQADTRPGQYVNEMLRNVPADLVEQAKNLATGTYDLVSVLAKATSEVGSDVGNFTREVIGLEPHYGGHDNLRALSAIPGAVASHYGQYLDPDFRAERVRDEPVGTALDILPVRAALTAAAPPVKAAAGAVRRGASAVAAAPARVADTAIGLLRGSPTGAIRGIAGQGPVETARSVFGRMAGGTAPEATPVVGAPASPGAPPASSPATPAPSVAPSALESASGRPSILGRSPHPEGGVWSPQRIQNELGIQARRQRVQLTEPQYKAATELVARGRTPAEAVAEVARMTRPPATVSAAAEVAPASSPVPKSKKAPARAKLTADEADEYLRLLEKGQTHEEAVALLLKQRALVSKLGTKAGETVRREVAERNATGRWPRKQD